LRGHKLCSHSVVSQHFMEPEVSLPLSQELSTCTYPEPDQPSPQHSILSLMSIFLPLGHLSKESAQVNGSLIRFVTSLLFMVRLAPHPTPKLEDHPLSFVRGCLFNIFMATVIVGDRHFHLQPKNAPCRGDKGIHLTWQNGITYWQSISSNKTLSDLEDEHR
jgi:hypothetical protein